MIEAREGKAAREGDAKARASMKRSESPVSEWSLEEIAGIDPRRKRIRMEGADEVLKALDKNK